MYVFPLRSFKKLLASRRYRCLHSPPHHAQGDRQLTQVAKNDTTKRTALVIGNSEYLNARKLSNPANDATDMAAVLADLGFEVIHGTNLNMKEMTDKVREFGDTLKAKGGVGLFYYAGHGVQVGGRNYLVPIEANIPREDEMISTRSTSTLSLEKWGRRTTG